MTKIEAPIIKHPVPTYFVLTFAISWGGVLLVIGGPGGITGTMAQSNPLFPFAVLAMIAGPSVAGILLTGLRYGLPGLRKFRSRLFKWQVAPRWYVIALLAGPSLAIATSLALLPFSPEFVPRIAGTSDKASLLLLGLAVAMAAGLVEELGWTGFVVPELRRRYGFITTGLIVGVLWSAWHVLVVVWGIGDRAGNIPLSLFVIVDGLTVLPAFRVLMVWIYDHTESLLVAMLMHVSLTASTLILWPMTTGARLMIHDFVFAAAGGVAVAAIAVVSGPQVSGQLLRRRLV